MWYYLVNGQQQGPVDETTFNQLISSGTIVPDSYVWQDGMANWIPLSQARAPQGAPVVAGDAAATCTVCGKLVGADNLIELLGNRVCANCKPIVLQSMREGASLPAKNGTACRDGKKVVAYSQTSLPARCFKCNQPVTTPPMTRKFHWHSPLFYLLIFVNLLIYVIVAIFVRKRGTLDIYLCEEHIKRRRYFIIGGWSGAVLGLVATFTGIGMDLGWLTASGIIFFLVATIAGVAGAQIARALRINGNTIWISGSGKEFLASLPPLP